MEAREKQDEEVNNPKICAPLPIEPSAFTEWCSELSPLGNSCRTNSPFDCVPTISPFVNLQAMRDKVAPYIMSSRRDLDLDFSTVVASFEEQPKGCQCKKSRCLKFYCECFANSKYCSDCECSYCFNVPLHEKSRGKAIAVALAKDPQVFKGKVKLRGCHCQKSSCLKKYCECFESGGTCTEICRCKECKNKHKLEKKRKL